MHDAPANTLLAALGLNLSALDNERLHEAHAMAAFVMSSVQDEIARRAGAPRPTRAVVARQPGRAVAPGRKLLSIKDLLDYGVVGISKTTFHMLKRTDRSFPRGVRVGKSVLYNPDDFVAWHQARAAAG